MAAARTQAILRSSIGPINPEERAALVVQVAVARVQEVEVADLVTATVAGVAVAKA